MKSQIEKYFSVETLDEIIEVLKFGDIKHPGDEWKNISAKIHQLHAIEHIWGWNYFQRNDAETRRHNLAHAAVRLLMALENDMRQNKK